jgi:hypothetical protein
MLVEPGGARRTFLSNHTRALMSLDRDPEIRLRDLADALSITERHAYGIVNDLPRRATS